MQLIALLPFIDKNDLLRIVLEFTCLVWLHTKQHFQLLIFKHDLDSKLLLLNGTD